MGQITGTITSATIVNGDIAAGAGISASKLQHQQVLVADWGYADTDGSVAVEDQQIFIASGTCTLREVKAWLVTDGTTTDIDFDLEINGSTALTGDINVTNSTGDGVAVTGTLASTALSAGDVLTAVIKTVTTNTGAQGPRMQVIFDMNYV